MVDREKEREHFRKLGKASAELEREDPCWGTKESRARIHAWINERRRKMGRDPLEEPDEDMPELQFYEIAKARGLLRRAN